jgi:hypothetical protein
VAQLHRERTRTARERLQSRLVLRDLCERDKCGNSCTLTGPSVVAIDACTFGCEIAGDVTNRSRGRGDLHANHRFENDGVRLLNRVEERLAAGGYEGHLLRIHRVMLAVEHRDANIL